MAKPPPKKSPGRPIKNESAPGVFRRGEVFWLRYSVGGEQVRVSLDTTNKDEANQKANELRGRAMVSKKSGRIVGGKTPLDREVDKYIAAKLVAKPSKKLSPGSAKAARQALKNFASVMSITDPSQITSDTIAEYYMRLNGSWSAKKGEVVCPSHKKSEATAQTYTTRVATFARWCGFTVEAPDTPEAPSRDITIPKEKVEELLQKATGDMKFILMVGFLAGMRRGEISWARPEWFNLARRKINIPNPDLVTKWRPKNRRARSIPMFPKLLAFIKEEYPDWESRKFCIRPEVMPGKAIYRFDHRKMFEAFAKKYCPELTPHVMRHTFITTLANNPKISVARLSEFSGDRIETLEKHYLHLDTNADDAAESFKVASETEPDLMDVTNNELLSPARILLVPPG